MKNPNAALEALTTPAENQVGRFRVREITLGTLAVLERLTRTDADEKSEGTWLPVVERFFAMTHPASECGALLARGRDAYRAAALEWADEITPAELQAITAACNAATARLHAASAATDGGATAQGANPTEATPTGG